MTKAYENEEFLKCEEARPIRILSEYLEPARRFQQKSIRHAVIVFGSARLPHTCSTYADAANFAERIARWTTSTHAAEDRYYLCTGGGPSIMEATHEGAARIDATLNVGLNISLPHEERPNPHLDRSRAVEFHYFFMRKFWFVNLARAAVVFPGGFGTLDELFELLTLTQTGRSSKMPIVLYDRAFWSELLNFDALVKRGLIRKDDLDLFTYADTPEDAAAQIIQGLTA